MSSNKRRNRKTTAPTTPNRPAWLVPAALVAVGAALITLALLVIQGGQQTPVTPQVTGKPSAEIDQAYFDYGEVRVDTPVETVFRVKNVGDQPLTILGEPRVELVEGCWPPRAVVSSTTINPGQEASVFVRFTMHAGMEGQHEFRVHVLTSDPDKPQQQVIIRSNWVS